MANINIPNDTSGDSGSNTDELVQVPCNGSSHPITQPGAINDKVTPAQLKQRERFALIVGLLKRIKPFLRAGFAGSKLKGNGNAVNRAISYNVCNAIGEDNTRQYIDFRKLRVSEGDLPGVKKPNIEPTGRSTLTIHWSDNSGPKGARPGNLFMCLVLCPDLQESMEVIDGSPRDRKQHTLSLPQKFAGHTIHVYGAFRRVDRSITSNSLYLGEIRSEDWRK